MYLVDPRSDPPGEDSEPDHRTGGERMGMGRGSSGPDILTIGLDTETASLFREAVAGAILYDRRTGAGDGPGESSSAGVTARRARAGSCESVATNADGVRELVSRTSST